MICLHEDFLALGVIHACERPLKNQTNVSFIDFKDVVSELAVQAESKMIIITSGPQQGFAFSGKFCIQSARRQR